MKNIAFGILVTFFILLSCRGDDDSIQRIDQIFNLYIRSSTGQDLLNARRPGSYTTVTMNDINGVADNAPVNFSLRAAADSIVYIEYIAGARRVTIDSISPENRTYESAIALALTRRVNDTVDIVTNDTLRIRYRWVPTVFEVSQVFYNNQLVFTKQPNVPNVITIVK